MTTNPEPICIDLTDGTTFTALIHVESEKLHVNIPYIGTFVIQPQSARQIALRILSLTEGICG